MRSGITTESGKPYPGCRESSRNFILSPKRFSAELTLSLSRPRPLVGRGVRMTAGGKELHLKYFFRNPSISPVQKHDHFRPGMDFQFQENFFQMIAHRIAA